MFFVVSQDEQQNTPVTVIELRADSYSADSGNVVISLRTKYSKNERKYSVPVECFRDLIIDLQRLTVTLAPTPLAPTQPDKPTEQVETLLPEVWIISE